MLVVGGYNEVSDLTNVNLNSATFAFRIPHIQLGSISTAESYNPLTKQWRFVGSNFTRDDASGGNG